MIEGACPTNEPVPRGRPLLIWIPIGLAVPGRHKISESTSCSGSTRRFSIVSRTFDFLPMLAALDAVEQDRLRVAALPLVLGLPSAAWPSMEELNLTTVSLDGV